MNYIICLILLAACAEACNEQDIGIAAGEVLEGAIESERRGRRGKYPNNACEMWHIRAEENQVDLCCLSKQKPLFVVWL